MHALRVVRAILVASAAGGMLTSAHAALTELSGVVDIKTGNVACALTNAGGVKCWGNGIVGDGQEFGRRTSAGDVIGLTGGVSAIGVGSGNQVCAAMVAGGVKCMGYNGNGEVGDGTTTRRPLPVDVAGISGLVTAIAGGAKHTCAILASGGVKCWGANDVGQLGIGSIGGSFPTPQDVIGLGGSAVAIAAGPLHTCVILSGAGAKCWGSNASGELGDGTTTTSSAPVAVSGIPADLMSIAAGGGPYSYFTGTQNGYASHSCVVTAAGGAKCWGRNDSGNLGDGTGNAHLTAFDVSGLVTGTASITAGGSSLTAAYGCCVSTNPLTHTCAVTASGGAKCWGSNTYGELGTGSSGNGSATPADVAGLTSGVVTIAAGKGFSCALTSDTKVKCWGHFVPLGYSSISGASRPPPGVPTAIMTGTLPQSIQVTPLNFSNNQVNIGGTGGVRAIGSSSIPVTFTSATPSVCSVGASFAYSDPFVEYGWTASVTGIASGLCQLVANEAGTAYYDPAEPVNVPTFRIGNPVTQTITFAAAPSVPVGGVGSLNATASSGLIPVTFTSNTPTICSVSGSVVTGLSLGSCTIAGHQAGDLLYGAAAEATLTFPITTNTGTHSLVVSVTGTGTGTVSSSPAGISCGLTCAANFAGSVTLTASPNGGFMFGGWSGACSGTGPCTLPMTSDATVGAVFAILSPIPRLANLSTRGLASTNDPLIAGFIIGGSDPKTVVISAAGPSLNAYGIPNAISDPKMELVRTTDGVLIASNNDWQAQSGAEVEFLRTSGLAPTHPREAALRMTLAPGAYTALVRGGPTENGIAVVGIFEADHPEVPLTNVSTRGVVATGSNVMIAGFIIYGSSSQTVVVNVAGPFLANYGITNPLANPKLTIVRSSDSVVIGTNDDWQTQTNPSDVAAIQATGFQPNDPAEPAVKLTLPPGAYTAIVEGVGGTIGTAVVGVFAVP